MKSAPIRRPSPAAPDAIAAALSALRATEAKAAEAAKASSRVDEALTNARQDVAEHAAARVQLDALIEARRPLLAAGYMGTGNAEALKANAAQIASLEAEVRALTGPAHDAESAIPELEARYTEAAAPVRVLGVEIAACRHRLLTACAARLLQTYGKHVETAMDSYLELVVLAQNINVYAKTAGLPVIGSEIPQAMTFPGINVAGWKTMNTAAAGPDELNAAGPRLAQRLQALGIE